MPDHRHRQPAAVTLFWCDRRPLGASVLVAALAIGVYLNTLGNPFVYDDRLWVVDNPAIRNLGDLRTIVVVHLFRPLVALSYALDYAGWGLQPLGYHLTSVLLHAATSVLVLAVFRRVVADAAPSGADTGTGMAFGAAAVFAVHPLLTEAVGYVSGRAEVLCAPFALLSLLALRRGLDRGGGRWLSIGVALLLVAVLAKEVAALVPLVLLASDRLLVGAQRAGHDPRRWRVHAGLLGLVVLLAAVRVGVFFGVERRVGVRAAWEYLLLQAGVVWRYLGLLLVPVGQSLVHPVPALTSPWEPGALLAGAGLIVLGLGLYRMRRQAPLVALGAAWFFLFLLPSSSVVALHEPMAEHRVYLASAGVFLAGAAGVRHGLGALAGRGRLPSWVSVVTLSLVIIGLSALTMARNRVWADPVTLWQDAAARAPGVWLPHQAVGDALREQGRCPEALPAYATAIRVRPSEPAAHTNRGICLAHLGRAAEAYAAFSQAARLAPGQPGVALNLGVAAALAGDADAARRHLLAALAADPRSIPARLHLAQLSETAFDDPGAALRLCGEIQGLAPTLPEAAACVARNRARLERAS